MGEFPTLSSFDAMGNPKASWAVGRLGGSTLLAVSFPLARDKDPNHDERDGNWCCSRSKLGNGMTPSVAEGSAGDVLVSADTVVAVVPGSKQHLSVSPVH